MPKQNNNLSPFLVKNHLRASEGAEKALNLKVIAALFPESCILSFLL
jgi:hypothetical protein